MVLWLAIGRTVVLGMTMGLELIKRMKIIGCAVTLNALEPWIFRIFHCNVGTATYFDVTSTQEAQKTKH